MEACDLGSLSPQFILDSLYILFRRYNFPENVCFISYLFETFFDKRSCLFQVIKRIKGILTTQQRIKAYKTIYN